MHNENMEAKKSSIPINQIIQNVESELEDLTQKYEELSDKGQVVYFISQKIQEKRDQLDSMKNFLQSRTKSV